MPIPDHIIDQIKREVDIVVVANDLGLQIKNQFGGRARAYCVFHDDSKTPNLMLGHNNGFKCFACGEHGDVIQLYQQFNQCEFPEAVRDLSEKYLGISVTGESEKPKPEPPKKEPEKAPEKPPEDKPPEAPESPEKPSDEKKDPEPDPPPQANPEAVESVGGWTLERLQKAHETLRNNSAMYNAFKAKRGLTDEMMAEKLIGWGGKFHTVPIRHKDGRLQNVRRFFSGKDKRGLGGVTTKFPYDLTSYDETADEVWIVEGEPDLWAAEKAGINAITGPCGAPTMLAMIEDNWELLNFENKKKIVLGFDNDIAGKEAAARIRIHLGDTYDGKVYRINWTTDTEDGYDLGDWFIRDGKTKDDLDKLVESYTSGTAAEDQEKYQAIRELLRQSPVVEKDGAYWKGGGKDKEGNPKLLRISSFAVVPKKMTIVKVTGKERGFIRADLRHINGEDVLENVIFPPEAWMTKQNFQKCFDNPKYTFKGSENDLQDIAEKVVSRCKQTELGIQYIGFTDDYKYFVGPDFVLGKDGPITNAPVSYIKQSIPLDGKIGIETDVDDVPEMIRTFSDNIFMINKLDTIVPLMGWLFACFYKSLIVQRIGKFPILSVFGPSGSGKTTTVSTLWQMFGAKREGDHQRDELFSARLTPFTAAKMLAGTNVIPLAVDELKWDRDSNLINMWKAFTRSTYMGETETRGQKDLTVQELSYKAPLILIGEMSIIKEQATLERTIALTFSRQWLATESGRLATECFRRIRLLPLTNMFPEIVRWIISEDAKDFKANWKEARKILTDMKLPYLPDRVFDNFSVVVFGIKAVQRFLNKYSQVVPISNVEMKDVFADMLKQVITVGRRTRMPMDILLEQLSIMSEKDRIKEDIDYKVEMKRWLYIHLPSCVAEFKKWARETQFDQEILDAQEYRAQVNEIFNSKEYIAHAHKLKRFDDKVKRCVVVDLRRAHHMGLDVSGFGIEIKEDDTEEVEVHENNGSAEESTPQMEPDRRMLPEDMASADEDESGDIFGQ